MIKILFYYLKKFLSILTREIKEYLGNYIFPRLPRTLNFKATDRCNAHCIMCRIWERKTPDLPLNDWEKILKNKFFRKVIHIGVSGGEPTLRDDLPQLIEIIIKSLKSLKTISLITNAIDAEKIYKQVLEIDKICKKNNIVFSLMISLDGIGKTHDIVRGTKGNFNSVVNLIKNLKNKNITVVFGATFTKINYLQGEDLLEFAQKHNIHIFFRIAEYINILYNEKSNVIRNFTPEQKFALQLFFYKIIVSYEKSLTQKRIYKNIIRMLSGYKRLLSCQYQYDAITLGANGEMYYCSPKSKMIGNVLEKPAYKIYKSNLKHRREIRKNYCSNCIHDYYAEYNLKEFFNDFAYTFFKALHKKEKRLKFLKTFIKKPNKNKLTIFIVGWYGTETVGDKAILGGIYLDLKKNYKDFDLVISSLYPFVTEFTLYELGIKAQIIDVNSIDFFKYSLYSDIIIMGGGPLMDLEELYIPQNAFYLANLNKKQTIIYGCGIGPLHKEKNIQIVKNILKNSTIIKLRDSHSVKIAKELTQRNDIELLGDPAQFYIKSLKIDIEKENKISCFLRNWTYEYAADLTYDEFIIKKQKFEEKIANFIKEKIEQLKPEKVIFYSMHNFVVGGDDRDFARYFIKKYFSDYDNVFYQKEISTINKIAKAMKSSKLNICMRFHSVVFAENLGVEYVAIDYTMGGKIYKYLKDRDKLHKIVNFLDYENSDNKHIR